MRTHSRRKNADSAIHRTPRPAKMLSLIAILLLGSGPLLAEKPSLRTAALSLSEFQPKLPESVLPQTVNEEKQPPKKIEGEEHHYTVKGLGLKLGDFYLSLAQNERNYATISRFRTTQALTAIAPVRFRLEAEGRRSSDGLAPRRYKEDIHTGRRASDAQLTYAAGIPRLEQGHTGLETALQDKAANPLVQRDTVDPATALLLAIGPMSATNLCDLDQPIFDGARRTRLVLSTPIETVGGFQCRGVYIREAGYSANQLRRARSFDLDLNYVRRRDGMFVLVNARAQTLFGPVTLDWRDTRKPGT